MSVGRLLRTCYLLYFSQPAGDRALYKAVKGQPVRSIVELGIGSPDRTRRLLEVAAGRARSLPLRYTGIDLFEARPDNLTRLSLKEAFAALRSPSVQVQLVPGDPDTALRRVANSLTGTDLLIIAADQDLELLARAWTWIPRILTATSLVFLERCGKDVGQSCWQPLALKEVHQLASHARKAARKAA